MSGEGTASFIRYSQLSSPELDMYRYNHKNKTQSRMIKFLTIICLGLALTLFLHEGYHWRKYCGNNSKDSGGDVVVDKISIITFDNEPFDQYSFGSDEDEDKLKNIGSTKSSDRSDTTCIPGSTKKMDCNTCTCNSKGTGYGCTKMGCNSAVKKLDSSICEPGSTKKMDCNTCTCNSKGTGYGCTKMACNSGIKILESGNSETCEPGSTKKMDCNTCTCNSKGTAFSCTKMACVGFKPKMKSDSDVCEPGSSKKVDCNTCICNDEGTAYGCTKMMCDGIKLDLGNDGNDE